MKAWSHLPNAAHIDRILADLEARPEVWAEAQYAARPWARDEVDAVACAVEWLAVHAAHGVARAAARDAVYDAARDAVWVAARSAARFAARDAARDAARFSILALVAYDDCAQYLTMKPDQLLVWHKLSEHPACVLLLPAVITLQKETI